MDFFPNGFPTQAQARVEEEKIRAYRELAEKNKTASWRSERETLIRDCILRIFLAFAEGACALGSENIWTVAQIESEANEFLRRLTIKVCYEKSDGRSITRDWTSHLNGSLTQEVERQFKESSQWRKYEDLVLGVAKVQANERPEHTLEALVSTSVRYAKFDKLRNSKTGPNRDPEVAKRRSLAKSNLNIDAREMCEIFDRQKVPLPSKWQSAGLRSWIEACKNTQYRSRISVLISKDRQPA